MDWQSHDEQSTQVSKQPRSKMVGTIALTATALLVLAVIWRVDDWSRDWTSNTAELDRKAARPELRPVELAVGVEQVVQQIERWARSQSAWEVEEVQSPDDQSARIHLTRTTGVFRFVDDIHVTIRANPSGNGESRGVSVHARSQSRVGKGDLGQNPRNLIELTTGLRNE